MDADVAPLASKRVRDVGKPDDDRRVAEHMNRNVLRDPRLHRAIARRIDGEGLLSRAYFFPVLWCDGGIVGGE